ncbi:MAG: hypothetical protein NWQ09_07790 [Nonlabens sp.]|nr:hypothetical protein [Nonlabens sp.]
MKTFIFSFIFWGCFNSMQAQVLIGISSTSDPSAALQFGSEPRGIYLQPVTLPLSPNAGTIVFDDATGSLRYYNGTVWSAVKPGGVANTVTDFATDSKVIIDASNSDASGIFIVESTTKAMVLPKSARGELNIKNPTPGLMYYDTINNSVMVYNGNVWVAY